MLFLLMDMADTPEDKIKVEALYKEYDRLMYYVAGKILRQKEDIEDAIMDAWIKIIKNLDKISEISCPQTRSFVVIIVERAAIDLYNHKKRHTNGDISIADLEDSPFFATSDDSFEEVELNEILRKIPKTYSEVLILHFVYNYTTKEIAYSLGISVDAAKKRLQRARVELKKAVEL